MLPTLPAEPLINHNVSWEFGQKIRAYLMDWYNKRYLVIIDYFFKYPFLIQMSSTTATSVIECLTELYALKGLPLEIFTEKDNPFNYKDWYTFTDKYAFDHTT